MLQPEETLQGLQVLVVDVNEDNCELLRLVLEPYQMQVYTAHSVPEALIILRQLQLDIVIIELELPEADGCELLAQIQALQSDYGDKAVAVAVTANIVQTEAKALAAGFAKLLWKPLDVTALGPMLAELICAEKRQSDSSSRQG